MTTPVLVRTREELAAARAALDGPVVLVPTMGALHEGHRALLRRARELSAPGGSAVATVFVNPLQFRPGEDLDRYPRTLADDLVVCEEEGIALVFAPERAEMYPDEPMVTVNPGPVGEVLEGEFRPGFFAGVLTVVAKLFGLMRPDAAVFGQKDAQQLALVRRMTADLNMGIEVHGVPIVRDGDGLATSSRNRYLSAAERSSALALSRALFAGRAEAAGGPAKVVAAARGVLDDAATADPPVRLDYLALADAATFTPLPDDFSGSAVLALAALVGSTRLIDNVPLVVGSAVRGGSPVYGSV
jgi:pantoate--beta-alanine ligase